MIDEPNELVREKQGVDDAILDRFSYKSLFVIVCVWLIGQFVIRQVFLS